MEGTPAKRKRVALACDTCRERKVRCDGKKPVCSQCLKRGGNNPVDCGYKVIADSDKRLSEHEYIQSLRRQVQDLQHAHAAASTSTTSPTIATVTRPSPSLSKRQASAQHASPSTSSPGTAASAAQQSQSSVVFVDTPRDADHSEPHGPSPISAMGAVLPNHDSLQNGDEFYGESSLVSLVREVVRPPTKRRRLSNNTSHNMSSKTRSSSASQHQGSGPRASSATSYDLSMLSSQFALPPRHAADTLLGVYFASVHIFYPYTHSVSFRKAYNALWESGLQQPPPADDVPDVGLGGPNCPRHVFFTALNAMLALGCEFSDMAPDEIKTGSTIFFDRIRALLRFDMLESGTLAQVQSLLLVGQYLSCTHYPTQCWNVVGLACRIAVGIGLQSSLATSAFSPLEMEMRRRAWHGCVQMDLFVSMTLGRPSFLGGFAHVPLPLAIDDECWELSGAGQVEQSPGTLSVHAFSVENIRLVGILNRILEQLYRPHGRSTGTAFAAAATQDSACSWNDNMAAMLNLDAELNDFESSLPDVLRRSQDGSGSGQSLSHVFRRQSNVLHARFCHMKLLLYRPSFTSHCATTHSQILQRRGMSSSTNTSRAPSVGPGTSTSPRADKMGDLTASMQSQCAAACVKSTYELVNTLHQAVVEGATGAWWYSLFYSITAGIILILTECTPSMKAVLEPGQWETAWAQCIQVMRRLGDKHERAERYCQSLILLRRRSLVLFGNPKPGNSNDSNDHNNITPPNQPQDSSTSCPDHGLNNAGEREDGQNSVHQSAAHNSSDFDGGDVQTGEIPINTSQDQLGSAAFKQQQGAQADLSANALEMWPPGMGQQQQQQYDHTHGGHHDFDPEVNQEQHPFPEGDFDIPDLFGGWDADLNSFMVPMAVNGIIELGYPVMGIL